MVGPLRSLPVLSLSSCLFVACGSPEPASPDAASSDATAPVEATVQTAPTPSAPPHNERELAERVVAALKAKDRLAYEALLWQPAVAHADCSASADTSAALDAYLADKRGKRGDDFAACTKGDWSQARVLDVKASGRALAPGEAEPAFVVGACTAAKERRDLLVDLVLGGVKRSMRIDEPVAVGDKLVIAGGLDCEFPDERCEPYYEHVSQLIGGRVDAPEAERRLFDGSPQGERELEATCQTVMRLKHQREKADAHMSCALAAATYEAFRACPASNFPLERLGPKSPAAQPVSPSEAASIGPSCTTFITAGLKCSRWMPKELGDSFRDHLFKIRTTIAGKPMDKITKACDEQRAAAKVGMKGCPSVTWD